MKKNYIGLATTFHDSALAIVDSRGRVVFAEATERYLQNKKAINAAPDISFRVRKLVETYCEADAELVIAHSWSGEQQAYVEAEMADLTAKQKQIQEVYGEVPFFLQRDLTNTLYQLGALRDSLARAGQTLTYELSQMGSWWNRPLQIRRYDHHLCHAATACFTSPFAEGVCAIIDGEGEAGRAHDFFRYQDGRIQRLPDLEKRKSGSLGIFFWMVCQACGFGILTGEEWKVMGLAPYGKLDPELYELLKSMIRVDGLELESAPVAQYSQILYELYRIQRPGDQPPMASADLAFTGQKVFMETEFELLKNLYAKGLSENLIAGGGCMLNSTANGKITGETGFKQVHIYSAPADDGNALGAALLAYYQDHPQEKPEQTLGTPYLGSVMSDATLADVDRFSKIENMKQLPGEIHREAARLIAEGNIIGWVQGRAEFGPRALGNRSILADPRDPQVKDKINQRVKFRESFRPFAPSILDEFGDEYFENYQAAPYMERTLIFREAVRDRVPGVVHANQSGRLQTVRREWNQAYYDLIHAFYELTGVPIVLNTSFNIMGKPIIHSVEDALAVFYTTGLDALVIGDRLIVK